MYFEGNQLLEISAVPVPANGEALALRSFGTDQMKSILNVEETDDSYIVTYAKYPPGEEEEAEEEEEEQDAFGDDDEEEGYGDDDEEQAIGDEEDEEDEDEDEDEDDQEEEAVKYFASAQSLRKAVRSIVQDVIIDLLAEDEHSRKSLINTPASPIRSKSVDAVGNLFGLDK